MSEADGKCSYPRPKDAPPCTQIFEHVGHCDWWEQSGAPVVERARRSQAEATRRREAAVREDAEAIVRSQLEAAIGNARYMLAQWDIDGWEEADYGDTVDWATDAARALRRLVTAHDSLAELGDD